jgi:PiT family inorganic phosphate transporter
LPVSTTHAIAGALVGVGSIQRFKAVRWGVATNIMWAWVLTIPASGMAAAGVFALIRMVYPQA